MKKNTIFLISILMAGLATFLFYQYTNRLSQEASSQQQMKSVVAAAVPIKKDQAISAKMLKTIEVPADSAYPDAVVDFSGVYGLSATTDIAENEVILKHHIQSLAESSFLSEKIQVNDRAVTLTGGKIETLANMIQPEDTIDIVYTGPALNAAVDKPAPIDTVLLQENVRVLAVGKRIKTTGAYADYDSITVEVQQSDAVKLIKASKKGTLNYILHSERKSTDTVGGA